MTRYAGIETGYFRLNIASTSSLTSSQSVDFTPLDGIFSAVNRSLSFIVQFRQEVAVECQNPRLHHFVGRAAFLQLLLKHPLRIGG